MAKNSRNRRFSMSVPLLPEVRLALFGLARGQSKTGMAEQIVIEKVMGALNWQTILGELRQEAALRRVSVEDLVKERLRQDGFDSVLDLDEIDWSEILDDELKLLNPKLEEEA
jgi:hypothetical protein